MNSSNLEIIELCNFLKTVGVLFAPEKTKGSFGLLEWA
jgi:hypothetical protein